MAVLDGAGFDLWADGYDQSVRISDEEQTYPFAGYKRVLGKVYDAVRSVDGRRVLELGFGTGILAAKLYQDGYDVTGIDFSQRMIDLAQPKMPGARLLLHDFSLGLPEEVRGMQYDAIYSTYALHHLADEDKADMLRRLFGLLAPGGVLAFGDIAFQTEEDQAAERAQAGEGWDADEMYLSWRSFSGLLPVPAAYRQVSRCAGVFVIKRPRMVLFDYGDTLANATRVDYAAGTRALLAYATARPQGMTDEAVHAFWEEQFAALDTVRLGNMVEVHQFPFLQFVYEYLGITFDLPVAEQEAIYWEAAVRTEPTEGIEALLASLQESGIRTGVISNIGYSGAAVRREIDRLLPEHAFEFVIATSEYVYRKPHRMIFELALRKAGLRAEDVWYCGDNFVCDVQGSSGAGIWPVWYTKRPDERARGMDCATIGAWKQLTAWMAASTIDDVP